MPVIKVEPTKEYLMRKMIRSKKYLSWEGRHRFRLYTACRRYLKDKTDGIRYEGRTYRTIEDMFAYFGI